MDRARPGLDRPGEGGRGRADPHGVGHLDPGGRVRRAGTGLQRRDRPANDREGEVAGSRAVGRAGAPEEGRGVPRAAATGPSRATRREPGGRAGITMQNEAETVEAPLAFQFLSLSDRPWAMPRANLNALIATCAQLDFDAVAARMGQRLDDARGVMNYRGTAVLNVRGTLLRYSSFWTRL